LNQLLDPVTLVRRFFGSPCGSPTGRLTPDASRSQHRGMLRLHATCIVIDGRGVLLRGPSGSGKSDLALRLIDGGARLVSDDQVMLTETAGVLRAAPPPAIAGRMEVRGLGIVSLGHLPEAEIVLLVDLVVGTEVERLPEPRTCRIGGVDVRVLALAPFEA